MVIIYTWKMGKIGKLIHLSFTSGFQKILVHLTGSCIAPYPLSKLLILVTDGLHIIVESGLFAIKPYFRRISRKISIVSAMPSFTL